MTGMEYLTQRGLVLANDSYLNHYGVKGMKWGVRKNSSGSVGSKISSAADKVAPQARSTKRAKTKVKSLSDDELRSAINRMRMEQEYVNMSKSKMSVGEKFVSGAANVGGTAIKVAAQQAATIAVKTAITAAARTARLPFELVLR